MKPEQFDQIIKQVNLYEKQTDTRLVKISLGSIKINLEVDPKVANPEIMNSGIQIIKFLTERPEIIDGKIINDMGTGCGIIGITAALLKAKKVFMEDIDSVAVENARRNTIKLNLKDKTEVFVSDLFSAYKDRPKAEVQIFNHPFFSVEPIPDKDWTRMMLGGKELIGRYLEDAPKYSTSDALYIFPWLTLADGAEGELDNDPAKRAPEYGYEIIEIIKQQPVNQGIQQSLFKIYLLKKKIL